ncbi:hypothetical protein IQ273_01010 [Nodosilinea sp. LEGE 07298]|uniref:hypothetical protein n=1 Tax=Nodosilinea sp. LEGE 07298 TaxID=2777970 RepID=UPI00187E1A73|nr:hypothetical protein [Nodosilinea sp. LEGE 07298]MBE9108004.1 hypothetical protein [Nodosilinea sp. LEGE 07298]
MLQTQSFVSPPATEAAPALLLRNPIAVVRDRRLRHYLVGSPDDTQHAIDRLHLLGYLERISWSHAIDIPASGLIIRPDVGDVLRYSQRDGRRLAR